MGMSVYVREFSGDVVDRLVGSPDVGPICSFAETHPALYPLLAGIDPYDDTYFNSRQAAMLATELQKVVERTPHESVREAAVALIRLASLLEAAPLRPHHRRLIFRGS